MHTDKGSIVYLDTVVTDGFNIIGDVTTLGIAYVPDAFTNIPLYNGVVFTAEASDMVGPLMVGTAYDAVNDTYMYNSLAVCYKINNPSESKGSLVAFEYGDGITHTPSQPWP